MRTRIELLKLELHNFKKFRELTLVFEGKDVEIRGENRTGKTTIADAISWVLFGKDAAGNSTDNFSIKTRDDQRQVIPMVDHSVEAVFRIDGTEIITLKRIYREIWDKKRERIQGHTTDYFWNEEFLGKKKEYDARVADIVSPEVFKTLTSTTHFANLPWQVRRDQLFQICEGVNEDLLNEAERKQRVIASKKREVAKRKALIPARVDECQRSLAGISGIDESAVKNEIEKISNEINLIKTGNVNTSLLTQKAELEAKMAQARMRVDKEKQKTCQRINDSINKLRSEWIEVSQVVGVTRSNINAKEKELQLIQDDITGLYKQWEQINTERPEVFDVCPTCGKPFTEAEKAAVISEFNLQQAQKKAEINNKGKGLRAKEKEVKASIKELSDKISTNEARLRKLEASMKKCHDQLDSVESTGYEDAEISEIKKEIADLESKLSGGSRAKLPVLEAALKEKQRQMAMIEGGRSTEARIAELLEEEKQLAAQIEDLESEYERAEQDIQQQAAVIEKEVNSKFEYAQFQLFFRHINGGIEPCCKIYTKDTHSEWGHGASGSECINLGLDIIKTLQRHYNLRLPLVIDNCEIVTRLMPMECQTIRFVKDETFEKLTLVE